MGNFNILPPDIILEILTWLPTESVLECKLVCKSWRNLVYHPCFSLMHLPHLLESGKLTFLCREFLQLSYLEYNEKHHEHSIRRININPSFGKSYSITGACNGLIFLNACHAYGLSDYQPGCICNPITKEYVILPKYNGFKNPKSYHLYDGFGYIHETNEYKVVRIDQLKGKLNWEYVEVYTLGSGSGWRNIGDCGLSSSMGYFTNSQGVFVSDSLYWITSTGKIVYFNLVDEKFREIPAPCLSGGMLLGLGIVSGFLCPQISSHDKKTDMWLLKKNKSQNMMEQEEHLSLKDEKFFNLKPLAWIKSGEVLCHNSKNLCSYDIKSCCSKTIMKFPQYIYQTIPHMNTLVSLKALGEDDTKIMK